MSAGRSQRLSGQPWRVKGGKKPADVVYVGRPGRWGNPYRVERSGDGRARVVLAFRSWLRRQPELVARARVELAGKRLACACPLDGQPCHADVWLEATT